MPPWDQARTRRDRSKAVFGPDAEFGGVEVEHGQGLRFGVSRPPGPPRRHRASVPERLRRQVDGSAEE
jgi:hypothetical protein